MLCAAAMHVNAHHSSHWHREPSCRLPAKRTRVAPPRAIMSLEWIRRHRAGSFWPDSRGRVCEHCASRSNYKKSPWADKVHAGWIHRPGLYWAKHRKRERCRRDARPIFSASISVTTLKVVQRKASTCSPQESYLVGGKKKSVEIVQIWRLRCKGLGMLSVKRIVCHPEARYLSRVRVGARPEIFRHDCVDDISSTWSTCAPKRHLQA